ncbi:MAG: HAMP domain-containing histidine kinase [Sulfurovaceae bacterium]|nr:HAMP domain-containing histidine kinase [Sulfurovaceae bacterium]
MIYKRPSLTEYIFARLISLIIFVTTIYTIAIFFVPLEYQNRIFHIGLFLLSLLLILFSVYIGARRVKRELKKVEKYISGKNIYDNSSEQATFFTKEFEIINFKLINILQKIRKQNNKKRKYTAKIKLKNRQRSDMLSAIAHEFRNPIASIIGYAQTLNEDEEIPANLRKRFLNKIYNNGEKIEELLNRLLLWNRFESGEQKLQLRKFDIYPLITDVSSNLQERYKNRNIIVHNQHLTVHADKALIEIVIKNLIENALKYSKEEIEVKIENNIISVIDKGVGISPENIEKVTKKFFRTDEHSWDNSMGLGLSIVKQILKLHNTKLEISSQKDIGSIFYFFI